MRTTWKPAEIGTLLIIGVLLMIDYDRCSCLVMKSAGPLQTFIMSP